VTFDEPFLLFCAIVLLANLVEAVTGFGSTILALTLAAQLYPIEWLVPVLVPINIVISAYIVVRHGDAIDTSTLLRAILPISCVGLLIGAAIFNLVHGQALELTYGAFVIFISIFELVRTRLADGPTPPLTRLKAVPWLLGGGIVQGIYASGGPLIVYYASRKLLDKRVFRSTLSSLWLILNIILCGSHVLGGKVSTESLQASGCLIPSLAIGLVLGEILHHRIGERTFRQLVFALLVVAGVSLLIKAHGLG